KQIQGQERDRNGDLPLRRSDVVLAECGGASFWRCGAGRPGNRHCRLLVSHCLAYRAAVREWACRQPGRGSGLCRCPLSIAKTLSKLGIEGMVQGLLLYVCYTMRGGRTRIISARGAEPH